MIRNIEIKIQRNWYDYMESMYRIDLNTIKLSFYTNLYKVLD